MNPLTDYKFKTDEFGLTDKGVHLLRKGYNYKTIDYSQINIAEIKRGKELKNWLFIFIIGTILLLAGVFIAIGIVEAFQRGAIGSRHVRVIFLLFIPIIGGYFVFSSLQTGTILNLNYSQDKTFRLSLKRILRNNEMPDFKSYLSEKLKSKLRME